MCVLHSVILAHAQKLSILLYNYYLLYNLEGNHIQGNIPFKIDHIGPTKGRQDTEIENGIFPHIVRP